MKARDDQKDAELKLSTLMDSMPDFVCFKDGEGRWLEANAFALNVFLLENVDYRGKKNTELVSPDHLFHGALKECDISDEAAWQKGTWRGEEIIPRPDGGAFIFDVLKVPSFNPDGSRKALTIVGRDITERKLAEDQAQILHSAIESSLEAVAMADLQGKVTYVNPACVMLWGYKDKSEMIGRSAFEFWANPENARHILAEISREKIENSERVARKKDGTLFDVHIAVNLVADASGKPHCIMVSAKDITERKMAEKALRWSQERLEQAMEQARIADWEWDAATNTFTFNERFYALYRTTAEREGGHRMPAEVYAREFLPVEEQHLVANSIAKLLSGESDSLQLEHRIRRRDGELRHIVVRVNVVRDDKGCVMGTRGSNQDITDLKRSEHLLERSEKKARHLNELLRAMYDIQHLIRNEPDEGKLLDGVCNVLVETRGYLAAWIGVPQTESKLVVPAAHAGCGKGISQEAPITWDDTPNGQGPSGTAVREWVPCVIKDIATDPRVEPWRQSALAVGIGSIASFPMIAEKRLWGVITIKANRPNAFSEEEIQLLTDLANEVGQAVQNIHHRIDRERLEEAHRQEQKMVAVGQLAGGVAHDFNNILGANMLQIGLLMERPDLTPELRQALEELEQGAFRASNLTRQLLLFSRKQAVQMKALDMKAVLESIHGMLARLLGETVLMKVQTDAELMWVKADHGMLEQVIVNLCVNARDAMPHGGKLTFRVEKLEIEAGSAPVHLDIHPGKFVCLSVADTGTGIAPEDIKHIFEPFYTTKEVGKGTGLGLATVHGIIQQHGGWIDVESKVGEGTVFRVYLPAFAEEQATAAEGKLKQIPRGRETILLVEDDVVLLRSVISGLQLLGYRVVEAVDGVDAWLKWQEHSEEIDLLLTDMVMPGGMNGLELAQQIQNAMPGFKVILSSGYSDTLNHANPELFPGITMLPKPYGISVLARTIRQCLDASGG
ncbi:MAG: PAS domain S-box protein [Verrucomicrobiota bacterium]